MSMKGEPRRNPDSSYIQSNPTRHHALMLTLADIALLLAATLPACPRPPNATSSQDGDLTVAHRTVSLGSRGWPLRLRTHQPLFALAAYKVASRVLPMCCIA
jgi:hypothetical protein